MYAELTDNKESQYVFYCMWRDSSRCPNSTSKFKIDSTLDKLNEWLAISEEIVSAVPVIMEEVNTKAKNRLYLQSEICLRDILLRNSS